STLRQLVEGGDLLSCLAVAENPAAPPEALEGLARSGDLLARRAVVGHPGVTAAALARLLGDEDPRCRALAAAHPRAPEERLRLAGASPDLVGFGPPDPDLEGEVLARLAEGPTFDRALAARHPSTPAALLAGLASDAEAEVRERAAQNPSLLEEVLHRLASDA